jgi:hypothetical protein
MNDRKDRLLLPALYEMPVFLPIPSPPWTLLAKQDRASREGGLLVVLISPNELGQLDMSQTGERRRPQTNQSVIYITLVSPLLKGGDRHVRWSPDELMYR